MGRRREGRPGLRPSSEVFDRIRWDPSLDERAFVVGYEDRFSGVEELPLVELVARGDVPWHRVRQVRVGELVVWDRAARIDRLFGSGDTAAEPSRIQAAIADVVATTRSREPSELIDVAVHRFDAARGVWARAADVAHEESSARRSLSVLTFNVLFDRYDGGALHTARRVPALLERLRREKADVIALQEVTPSLLASLLAEPWVQREYWVSDGPDAATIQPYGVLLLARAPFTARLRPGRKGRGKRVLYGELSARGRRLLVAVLHLTSDRSQEAAVRRAAELDVIADDLARWSGARLVLGDFNAEGAGLDARLRAAGLIDLWRSLRPDDTGPTFDPGRNRLARLSSRRPEARRLDRVLLGYGDDPTWLRPVDVALFATKPEVPTPDGLLPLSDHWGLRARLELIGGLPAPAVDAKPTHRTALALIPPRELWPAIQALRSAHDRAYRRWMPHVTLLYGFVPADALPDAAAAIEAALVDTPAFEVSLETIRSFDRHRGATLWLDPACAPSDALRSLQRRLQGLFPRCDEVSNRGPHGYTPHLTVGQQPADAAAEARARWQAAWRPLAFTAASVAILRRDGDAPFHVARVIPLAPASTIKVDAPALPEAWARRRDAIAQAWSEVVGDVRSIVHVVGSHRLGAAGPGADLDLVAVAPARVDLATLFADVQRALAAAGHEVQGRAILDAVAPRLAMTLDGGAVDLQAIQCPKGHAAPETRDGSPRWLRAARSTRAAAPPRSRCSTPRRCSTTRPVTAAFLASARPSAGYVAGPQPAMSTATDSDTPAASRGRCCSRTSPPTSPWTRPTPRRRGRCCELAWSRSRAALREIGATRRSASPRLLGSRTRATRWSCSRLRHLGATARPGRRERSSRWSRRSSSRRPRRSPTTTMRGSSRRSSPCRRTRRSSS
ncbi:MAG: RNA repair domain-containing protein [Nannocystaceae bacterium]